MAIQTTIKNDRGEVEELHPHDPRYWSGPWKYEPYPKDVYRASAAHYQDEDIEVAHVRNEQQHRALGSAWQESKQEAREYYDKLEAEIARAAAEVSAAAQRMSTKAQAELREAEQATDEFVTDVKPKRRGWSAARRAAETRRKKTEPINVE